MKTPGGAGGVGGVGGRGGAGAGAMSPDGDGDLVTPGAGMAVQASTPHMTAEKGPAKHNAQGGHNKRRRESGAASATWTPSAHGTAGSSTSTSTTGKRKPRESVGHGESESYDMAPPPPQPSPRSGSPRAQASGGASAEDMAVALPKSSPPIPFLAPPPTSLPPCYDESNAQYALPPSSER